METLEKNAMEIVERRNISREKLQEIAQKLLEIAINSNAKVAGEIIRIRYSNAYSGCYDKLITFNGYAVGDYSDKKIYKPELINAPKTWLYNRVDYGCDNIECANTKTLKNWCLEQIENIKNLENFEENFLAEIKAAI